MATKCRLIAVVFAALLALDVVPQARSAPAAPDPITFAPRVDYDVGDSPAAVITDEFGDSSGRADLVVANEGSDTVSILAGMGGGTFSTEPTNLAVGSGPVDLVGFGDRTIDDDYSDDAFSYRDLVVANKGSDTITIVRRQGDGSFSYEPTLTAVGGPSSVSANQLYPPDDSYWPNRLIVTNAESDTVSVFAPDPSTGRYSDENSYTESVGPAPVDVAIGDFLGTAGGDDLQDLAVANSGSDTISLVEGCLGPSPIQTVTVEASPSALALTPLDSSEDATFAVLVANRGSDSVSVLPEDGNDNFSQEVTVSVGDSPASIAATDFDGDGCVDVAVANQGDGTISILRGDGSGHFSHEQTITGLASPSCVISRDLNDDGRPDLVVTQAGADCVSVILSTTRYATSIFLDVLEPRLGYGEEATLLGFPSGPDDGVEVWAQTAFDSAPRYLGTAEYGAIEAPFECIGATATVTSNTRFLMHFSGDATYAPSMSNDVLVYVTARLGRPVTPTSVRRGWYFTTSGSVLPRHPYAWIPSRSENLLYFYRRVNGRYVYSRRVRAWMVTERGATRYYLRYRLPYAGRWMVKARHYDASHAVTWSAPRYLLVR